MKLDDPRLRIIGLVVGVVIVSIVVAMLWYFVTEPGRQAVKAAVANATAVTAAGDSRASEAAAGAVADYGSRQADRTKVDTEHEKDIQSQPGAAVGVEPDVAAALLRSLCDRETNRNKRECVQLREAHSAAAPQGR